MTLLSFMQSVCDVCRGVYEGMRRVPHIGIPKIVTRLIPSRT